MTSFIKLGLLALFSVIRSDVGKLAIRDTKYCLIHDGRTFGASLCTTSPKWDLTNGKLCKVDNKGRTTGCLYQGTGRLGVSSTAVALTDVNQSMLTSTGYFFTGQRCYGYNHTRRMIMPRYCRKIPHLTETPGKWEYYGKCFTAPLGRPDAKVKLETCRDLKTRDPKYSQMWSYSKGYIKTHDGSYCLKINGYSFSIVKCDVGGSVFTQSSFGIRPYGKYAPCFGIRSLALVFGACTRQVDFWGSFKILKSAHVTTSQTDRTLTVGLVGSTLAARKVGSMVINEKVAYYYLKVNKAIRYTNFGWGKADQSQHTSWIGDLGLRKKYSIASFSVSGGKRVFEYLDGLKATVHQNKPKEYLTGAFVKCSRTTTFVRFEEGGKEYHTHVFTSGDNRELYPAIDLHYSDDSYTFTLGPRVSVAPKAQPITFEVMSKSTVRYTQENRSLTAWMENSTLTARNIGSMVIKEKVYYYHMKVNKAIRYSNFGWGKADQSQHTTWVGDMGLKKKGSVSTFSSNYDKGAQYVFNMLDSIKFRYYTSSPKKFLTGSLVKVSRSATQVEFETDGKVYFRYTFGSADNKDDLYPAADLHYTEDNYTFILGPEIVPATTAIPTTLPTTPAPTTPYAWKFHKKANVMCRQMGATNMNVWITNSPTSSPNPGSIVIREKVMSYMIKIYKTVNISNFGWARDDGSQHTSWVGDLGQGKSGSIGLQSSRATGKAVIKKYLGNTSSIVSQSQTFFDGSLVKTTRTNLMVDFIFAGRSVHRHYLQTGDNKYDLFPAADIYNNGDYFTFLIDYIIGAPTNPPLVTTQYLRTDSMKYMKSSNVKIYQQGRYMNVKVDNSTTEKPNFGSILVYSNVNYFLFNIKAVNNATSFGWAKPDESLFKNWNGPLGMGKKFSIGSYSDRSGRKDVREYLNGVNYLVWRNRRYAVLNGYAKMTKTSVAVTFGYGANNRYHTHFFTDEDQKTLAPACDIFHNDDRFQFILGPQVEE